jgi:WD40 repeat protein
MRPAVAARSRVLLKPEGAGQNLTALSVAPDGTFVAATNALGELAIVPLDGGSPRRLSLTDDFMPATAVGPGRHLVAAGSGAILRKQGLVRVWDPATGDGRLLDAGDSAPVRWLRFESEEVLLVANGPRLRRWSLAGASPRILDEVDFSRQGPGGELQIEDLTPDGREALLSGQGRLWIEDLAARATREVVWNGAQRGWVSFDPSGRLVVSTDGLGAVRVGSARGGEPHLLLRQRGEGPVVVSPDGQRIASGGKDGTIRLWPMPDLSKPPLHTLPHGELLAKLRSLTNLRAVRESASPTGWKIEVGPFPGWNEVPTW